MVETSPSSTCKRQTCHIQSITLYNLIEWYLLDDLETERRLAALAFTSQLLCYNISNHLFQTHVMLSIVNPLLCNYLNVFISDLEGYLPLVYWKIGYRVIRNLVCHISSTFNSSSLIIRHYSQIILNMIEVNLKLFVNFLSVNSPLIYLL